MSAVTNNEFFDIPNLTNFATYYWTVDAVDGQCNFTDVPTEVWSFAIMIPPPDNPPYFTGLPPGNATEGKDFVCNVTADDLDGDMLIFSIIGAPKNMTLDSRTGEMHWPPDFSDIGNHSFKILVSDGKGGVDEKNVTIAVLVDTARHPQKPQCTILSPVNGSIVSGAVRIRGEAINGTNPVRFVQIRIDGHEWMNTSGRERWTIVLTTGEFGNGKHVLEARASDGNLFSNSSSIILNTNNPNAAKSEFSWYAPVVSFLILIGIALILFRQKRKK
jgi:hypothetical protein